MTKKSGLISAFIHTTHNANILTFLIFSLLLSTFFSEKFHLKDFLEKQRPSQHFNVGSTLFQDWFDVENKTKSHVGFSTLHNVDTTSIFVVETTLKQHWYNYFLTLFQRISTIVKTLSKPVVAGDKHGFINR